jgi:predicted DNA-binding transcriptional regulator YafY
VTDTTGRVLRLLNLLGSRPVWSGPDLAERLGVTTRTVRRDVDRLRQLGYPVQGDHGVAGGYRLGSGGRLPPLLLDDDEAVAVVVCLRLGAGGTIEGIGESAMRTLAKLDQVLPARLRSEVAALSASTVTLPGTAPQVDPDTLMTLARAVRDGVRVRFPYVARGGDRTARDVEPYRLVATGRRWYLLGFDLDRDDWRVFRLDRMEAPQPTSFRFRRRDEPDAATYVQQSLTRSNYRFSARTRLTAPAAAVRARVPASIGTVEPVDATTSELVVGADELESLALHLAWVALDLHAELTIVDPPDLAEALRRLGSRMRRFGGASR